MITLTPTLARRLAITRQRLATPAPDNSPNGIMDIMADLGCLQIDPIRAVERTQYLVLWSRLGTYDPTHLDTLCREDRRLFEYWAHAASIVLTDHYPIHRTQMHRVKQHESWQNVRDWLKINKVFKNYVLDRLKHEGPLSANQLEDRAVVPWKSSGWNDGRNVGQMLSFLWDRGEIMVAGRQGLRRLWALTDTWLPPSARESVNTKKETVYQATQISLRALGIGTAKHIENHFIRNCYGGLDATLRKLIREKKIHPVHIRKWPDTWYIHDEDLPLIDQVSNDDTWTPRTTLLSPFDNLICNRERTELMWDFRFRIEIYVPPKKRQYGYYVLPILHGDQLIGRIDPKMDRKTHTLHINAVYAEPSAPMDHNTAEQIAISIKDLAIFLEAKSVQYTRRIPAGWRKALQSI